MANEPNEDEPLFHAATYTQAPKVSHKVLTKEERQVLIKQHEEKQQEAAKLDQVASKGPVGRWWSRLQSGPNRITPAMAIVALGVVYGDIGTSPLYTMQTFLNGQGGLAHADREAVLGVLSLVFWSITLITTVKYVLTTRAKAAFSRCTRWFESTVHGLRFLPCSAAPRSSPIPYSPRLCPSARQWKAWRRYQLLKNFSLKTSS